MRGTSPPKFLDELKKILREDNRFVKEGQLLKNAIVEHALKLDKELIRLLLSKKRTKDHFFVPIDGVLVFDKDEFVRFVNNKDFLPDSYTSFKNRIGLTSNGNGDYLRESKDVVLVWPYKDCVLEGGQTKEDQKRDEIFWNETLAPDEIDRLFEPKVLTNFKRFNKDGEDKVTEIKDTDNLIIKGNNLLALHSLKKRFAGKVKLIYIDPPYNTGGSAETFTYNNTFNHSTWLTFIKNRLDVAKEFLRDDGFVAITIDHCELFYLGSLADEVLRRENRLGIVSVVSRPQGRQFSKFFSATTEYMLVYAKDWSRAKFKGVVLDEERKAEYNQTDEKGKFKYEPLMYSRFVEEKLKKAKNKYFYPIYVSKNLNEITLEKKQGYYEVWPINKKREICWRMQKDKLKILLAEKPSEYKALKDKEGNVQVYEKYREESGTKIKTHWIGKRYNATTSGTGVLKSILGEKMFSYPKSLYAVLDTLKIMTNKDDIILDFFSGSGTTGHATLELNKEDGGNRKCILVEQLDEHIEICKQRMQKVIENNGQGDFVYCELVKWNGVYIEKLQKAKTKADLAKIWQTMKEKAQLSYKIDLKTVDQSAQEFDQLSFENQRKFLLEVLDKNQLYVNYSEIDDADYKVSKEDKRLNRMFYKD